MDALGGDQGVTSVLRHGDINNVENSIPRLDHTIETNGFVFQNVREAPFEVHFEAEVDCITLPLIGQSVEWAPDTDKIVPGGSQIGQACFHPAGSKTFCRSVSRNGDLIVVEFPKAHREHFLGRDWDKGSFAETQVLTNPDFGILANMIRSAVLNSIKIDGLWADGVGALLLAACRGAEGRERTSTPQKLSVRSVDKIFEFIESNLSESLRLSDLAEIAGLSPFHLSRAFKSAVGLSPHQYLLERRIVRARELLQETRLGLAEIAYSVGFSSQAHFTDVFRKRLNVTPGAYRKDVLK